LIECLEANCAAAPAPASIAEAAEFPLAKASFAFRLKQAILATYWISSVLFVAW